MNYYTIEILNEMLNLAKQLKSEYVLINGNLAIGVDIHCNIMKTMKFDKVYHRTGFLVKNLGDFLKELKKINSNNLIINNNILRSFLIETTTGLSIQISDNRLDDYILNKYIEIQAFINKSDFLVNDTVELNDCTEFIERLNMKTKDGSKILNIHGYPLTVYSSLLPVNKNDEFNVTIYDNSKEIPTFLCKYNVKKKNNVISVFVNYLKLPVK